MKYKLHTQLLITVFLLAGSWGYGGTLKVRKDTLNTKRILEQADSIRLKRQQAASPCKPAAAPLIFPKVTKVGSFATGRDSLLVFGDYIYITVDSIEALLAVSDSLAGKKKDSAGAIILYINGNAMRDIGVLNFDKKEHELVFYLDRHSKYLFKFYPEFPYLWSKIPVSVSAGFKNGTFLQADHPLSIYLKFVSRWSIVFSFMFIIISTVVFVVLAAKTNLIRIGDDHSPFSLGLTQLSFWTIVVGCSFIYIWIVTDVLPPISGSTLILISVSALTTAGSRLVDIRTKTPGDVLQRSKSFLEDILQDELGYSVHRAQMFMWTIILGFVFVSSVIRFQQIPQLDESLLALMGISSGAYVGLKTMENKKDPNANPVTPVADTKDGLVKTT